MPPLCSQSMIARETPTVGTEAEEQVTDHCDFAIDDTESPNEQPPSPPMQIVWRNAIIFACLHLASLYGVYLMFTSAMWQTNVFTYFLYIFSGMGVTAGAHRLWAHRSYKAKLPLRILLAFLNTMAFENDIYEWTRDHRAHHKYSETDADPHDARRGFFFSHIGWLLCRKHPEVIRKGKAIDTSDLLADPVVMFQRRFYLPLVFVCCFMIPIVISMWAWGETFSNALFIPTLFRFCLTLNVTWLVNSAAHMWGTRPYDTTINPRQNAFVVFGTVGEGFHNYHHTFPYDYAASEYGIRYNFTTMLIDFFAWFGLAYDRKTASTKMISARKQRTGINENGEPATKGQIQNGVMAEQIQSGVLETSKIVLNGVSALSKVVKDGVNDILKTSNVSDQDNALETSKIVLNGVSDVLSKVYRNGMKDILKATCAADNVASLAHKRSESLVSQYDGKVQYYQGIAICNSGLKED